MTSKTRWLLVPFLMICGLLWIFIYFLALYNSFPIAFVIIDSLAIIVLAIFVQLSYPSLERFTLRSRYLLIARGIGLILFGLSTLVLSYVSVFIMVLPGITAIAIVIQEWQRSPKRRWFLFEGLFGIALGVSLAISWFVYFLVPCIYCFFELYLPVILCLGLWVIAVGIGNIIASNGWALTTSGIFALLYPIVFIAESGKSTRDIFIISIIIGYPLVVGILSIIAAFQGRTRVVSP